MPPSTASAARSYPMLKPTVRHHTPLVSRLIHDFISFPPAAEPPGSRCLSSKSFKVYRHIGRPSPASHWISSQRTAASLGHLSVSSHYLDSALCSSILYLCCVVAIPHSSNHLVVIRFPVFECEAAPLSTSGGGRLMLIRIVNVVMFTLQHQ